MSAILRACSLQKAYRRRLVVRDVSFEVHAGEIVGLLGPNGAGKTTSFNMATGLVAQDAGQVFLMDTDLQRLPLYRRARLGLGYLAQESTVFRGLSAFDNLAAILEAQGVGRRSCQARSTALLEAYNLSHVGHTLGRDLSGGERRRLEMARALVSEPKVLLLDEPFAGVDPIAVAEIRRFIQAVRDRGIGVLLTDHNVRETLSTCDRAYLIHEGKILLEGSPAQIVASQQARKNYLGQDFRL
ncbi:MAG: LPS export ABC transporter ATP-binding protein [Deltaproteobacteria bacterium]|nr:MAG: LPS export ABC transporter ATP-binding protein [Deltaproteobacteria bacterium]